MNLEKGDIGPPKKVSWWLNGLIFKKQSLATISTQGFLMHTALKEEAYSKLPACTVFLPSEPTLIKEILFQPVGLRLSPFNQSYTAISPSAFLSTNQNDSILINQYSAFLTTQTLRIWNLHLHEDGHIRNQG